MSALLAAGLFLAKAPAFDFYRLGPYDRAVPRPESILGYELGAQHTVFRDQERVVLGIAAAAKARVVPIEYGRSTQGRPLRVFAISSPENIARLEQIRQDIGRLADPAPGQDNAAIIKRTPPIVWINECIHGDETASFESGMALIYNLAASRNDRIERILRDVVVIVNPVYNPDGHERYVVAYNSIPNGSPDFGSYDTAVPFAFTGRANHYRFDMNRDRAAITQAETRQEVALFLRWNPQVYVDQHGQVENYFFPPVQQSVNVNVGRERYNKWTEVFGRASAAAFDERGWSYYIKDAFDFYHVGYLDTHTTLMGAIGMTHETDGGRTLVRRRSDDTLLTMRDGAAKHFVSALAVIEASAQRRTDLLESYANFKSQAVSGSHAGKFQRVVVTANDPREVERLRAALNRTGIKSFYAAQSWTQGDTHDYWSPATGSQTFPAGALVIDMAQTNGPLAKAWLEPGSDFEPEFVARQKELAKVQTEGKGEAELDSYEFYDSTAWCRIYAHNVQAWWCESSPTVPAGNVPTRAVNSAKSPVGYVLPYTDQEDILFVARALTAGFKCAVNPRPMTLAGKRVERGSFLFLTQRNEEGYDDRLIDMAKEAGLSLLPLATSYPDVGRFGPGSENIIHLRKPVIGIVAGTPGSLGDFGPIWYLMEREFKLPFTALNSSALNGSLEKYTCIVVPGGPGASLTPKLREWVQGGGCLVSLSNASWLVGSSGLINLESFEAKLSLPGALFRAELDPKSRLSFGYHAPEKGPISIAVPLDDNRFAKAPKAGSTVMLSADPAVKKLLSGWTWDDTEKDLAGVAWLHEDEVGGGRVVAFGHNPTERAQWPGLYKLVLNSMILGSGR